MKSRIIEFDTSDVTKIILYPKLSKDIPVEFNRNTGKWSVQQGNVISAVQKGAVKNIFSEVLNIKPQSLAALNKVKWKEFELTDSLATRVKFLNIDGKTIGDLMVGKFIYKQVSNPYGGNGANNIQGTTFVRLYGEKEVYGVEGFLAFFFGGKFDDWRDKTFLYSNTKDITSISFAFPADSSYKLSKKGSVWYTGNEIADSSNIAGFLNTIGSLNGQEIKDSFEPSSSPAYQLLVEGNNLLTFNVKCYKESDADEYILNSSHNPDVYFTSKRNGIFEKVFKPYSYFVKKIVKQK